MEFDRYMDLKGMEEWMVGYGWLREFRNEVEIFWEKGMGWKRVGICNRNWKNIILFGVLFIDEKVNLRFII